MSEHANSESEVFALAANQPKITGTISALVTSIGLNNLNLMLGVVSTFVGLLIGIFTMYRMWQSSKIAEKDMRIKDLEIAKLESKQ
jgi:RsiW-degrading membrane proteinase PrsW (M82 family)